MTDSLKAIERKFTEQRPPLAYAKLTGKLEDGSDIETLLTHLPAELGRGQPTPTSGAKVPLGDQKAMSRQHARIEWDSTKGKFQLTVLGKNGIHIRGKNIAKDETVDLPSQTPLKIGQTRVYFLTAIRSACSTMGGVKLLSRAFDKAKSAEAAPPSEIGVTVETLCDHIFAAFPRASDELGGRENLLTFFGDYLEADTANYERLPGTQPPRYRQKPSETNAAGPSDTESAKKKQKTSDGGATPVQ